MLLVYPLTLELVKKNIVCKEINRLIIRDKLTAKTEFFQKENTTMRQTEKKSQIFWQHVFKHTPPKVLFIKHLFNSITFNIMLCI